MHDDIFRILYEIYIDHRQKKKMEKISARKNSYDDRFGDGIALASPLHFVDKLFCFFWILLLNWNKTARLLCVTNLRCILYANMYVS